MDNVTFSKYGWILIVAVIVFVFGASAPMIGERITDKIIVRAVEDLEAYNVTLDAGDGTTDIKNILVANGKPYGYLPTPEREGKTFLGWYTTPTGGEEITSQTIYTGDTAHTLYALWG